MAETYISGTQLTNSVNSLERKVDIPDEILYLEPDNAPLVHLTMGRGAAADGRSASIKKRVAINPEFKMLEKASASPWTSINNGGGYTAGATTLTVDDSTNVPQYAVLKVVGGEQLLVLSKPTATSINVKRAYGDTSAAAIADDCPLYVTSIAMEEGSTPPTAIAVQVRSRANYLQIIRKTFGLSRTLQKSELYGGKKREDLRKENFLEIMRMVERAFIYNEPYEGLTSGPIAGNPLRMTGGVNYWLTDSGSVSSVTTTLTKQVWITYLRNLFRYGSRQKVVLCAPIIIDAVNYWKDGKLQMRPDDYVYGLKCDTWETGHGTAYLVRDIALENSTVGDTTLGFGGFALGLDLPNLWYRYLTDSDIALYEDIVKDGRDGWMDEYMGEVGLHLQLPETHRLLTGVEDYS